VCGHVLTCLPSCVAYVCLCLCLLPAVRLGNYNSKTLSYVQNFEVSTNDGHKFEYVFTN
jgi:hypothetical protein